MGVQQATPLLDDLSKGVANVASMLGGQVRGEGGAGRGRWVGGGRARGGVGRHGGHEGWGGRGA
jgi:hypothetical protein